jgi:isopenicillin N synthase-like dioxygenase
MHVQIPIIDISDPGEEDRIASELVDAARTHGFVYIKNQGRGVPVEAIEEAFNLVIPLQNLIRLSSYILQVYTRM